MPDVFTSIGYPIAVDDALGTIQEETDYGVHIVQLIKQVLFTSPGERINRPDFGCGIKRMVFAPNSDVAASLVQVTIYEALNRWLGTAISVSDVKVNALGEVLEIRIGYVLKARREKKYLNLEVTL
jgi:phage baseplate assembly protein W